MTFSQPAKFVRRYADVSGVMREALKEYRRDVEARTFPSDAESYHLSRELRELMVVSDKVAG
jgi:3-methyl-2-oxobutanoate hydroxymethyltransferase